MANEGLIRALSAAGHAPIELRDGMGATIVILPYGARVLGLLPKGKENLLWTHPMLQEARTAVNFFAEPGWRNTGGDRTWVSPERDLNVRDLKDPWNSYEFPKSLDPGNFIVKRDRNEVRLATQAEVTNHRLRRSFQVYLEKTIQMISNPLRYEPDVGSLLQDIAYAGYEQSTVLNYSNQSLPTPPPVSLWDVVALPAGGQVVIPTVGRVQARDFFEPTGPKHLIQSGHGLRFVFDAEERHKIAVRATALLGGRAGYYRKLDGNEATLVVRNFAIDPSGEYVDTPWDDPNDRGYVLECYNDSGLNGAYGEIEYHTPAMGEGTGQTSCFDRAQLWGFQGPVEVIGEVMRRLLGSPVTDELFSGGNS